MNFSTLQASALSRIAIIGISLLGVSFDGSAGEYQSLRGSAAAEADSLKPSLNKWSHDSERIPREFAGQPPLIPHSIIGYKIDLRSNKCLSCHSVKNYEENDARRIGITHLFTRNRKRAEVIAPSRYFCTQCHVAQIEAKPLVENLFEPAKN